jgi:hypothetical protein
MRCPKGQADPVIAHAQVGLPVGASQDDFDVIGLSVDHRVPRGFLRDAQNVRFGLGWKSGNCEIRSERARNPKTMLDVARQNLERTGKIGVTQARGAESARQASGLGDGLVKQLRNLSGPRRQIGCGIRRSSLSGQRRTQRCNPGERLTQAVVELSAKAPPFIVDDLENVPLQMSQLGDVPTRDVNQSKIPSHRRGPAHPTERSISVLAPSLESQRLHAFAEPGKFAVQERTVVGVHQLQEALALQLFDGPAQTGCPRLV